MAGLTLRQIHPLFAAEATGIDMTRPLAPEEIAAVTAAMDRFAVLVFPGQAMEQEQQVAMARQFGPLNPGLKKIGGRLERMRDAALIDISNLDAEGRPVTSDSKKMISMIANQLWHSDSSFQSPAVSYSMLNAVRLPSWGAIPNSSICAPPGTACRTDSRPWCRTGRPSITRCIRASPCSAMRTIRQSSAPPCLR